MSCFPTMARYKIKVFLTYKLVRQRIKMNRSSMLWKYNINHKGRHHSHLKSKETEVVLTSANFRAVVFFPFLSFEFIRKTGPKVWHITPYLGQNNKILVFFFKFCRGWHIVVPRRYLFIEHSFLVYVRLCHYLILANLSAKIKIHANTFHKFAIYVIRFNDS